MKTYRNILIVLLTVLAGARQVSAQGSAFSYQGRLNTNGVPATGLYDFQFYLRDALTAGNPVGITNNQPAVGVTNGLFGVTLDFGTAAFNGGARWLEITVRTNGGIYTNLSPREPILTVPYAITASNLSGTLPASQLSGSLLPGSLAGTYSSAVTLNNAGNTFTGNGGGLTALNASQLTTGTLPDGRLSSNVALRSGPQTFTGVNTFSNLVSSAGGLVLNDAKLFLRPGSDANHGLAYSGNTVSNFGAVLPDGPVLWGFGGGALGAMNGGPHALLTWTPTQVLVNSTNTGGWADSTMSIQNGSPNNSAPALRVLTIGNATDGSLSVSANGVGYIARFGNAYGWVLDIMTNGAVQANGPIKANGGLIIENRTSDPASPQTGQIWLRTDL